MLTAIDRILTPIDGIAARFARPALSPRAVFAIWGGLLLLLFAMRAFVFTGTDADDAEQLIHMQNWALGYGARNPPFFTWLVLMVEPIFGVSVAGVVFVKFVLLAGSYYLIYRSGVIVFGDRSLAALAALSPIALFYVAWDATFHYTHSIILAFAVCLTFHQLLVLERRRDVTAYALLGIGIAFGLLSKYNYLIFVGVLLAAVLIERDMRRLVLDPRFLVTIAVSLSLAAPHYYWLWQKRISLSTIARDRFNPHGAIDELLNLGGIGESLGAAASFLLPLGILCLLCFPRALGLASLQPAPNARYRRILDMILFGIVLATIVGVMAFGAERVRNHYMFLLILFPLGFLLHAQTAGISARSRNLFAVSLVFIAILVPTAVVIKYFVDPLRSGKAYFHVPYAEFASQLKAAGFSNGTIVGDWFGYPLAGNFRPYFPEARIVSLLEWQITFPKGSNPAGLTVSPRQGANGQCLLLWSPFDNNNREAPVRLKAKALLGVDIPPSTQSHFLTAEMTSGHGRKIRIGYILLPNGSGNCR